ncbi:alanine racemase domain-containing protein [Gloeomargarita lithophora Alchichica-D10]|uniref:Pyridoxal phosphate homeostasis protein n=1 Tax=Gloeomargarita lithophora Alchichica-D10 TaxID=1188229 RepID=A0A1J0ABT8_9CYAN|nr:YggS family pyridoxal phosphate-dependent enzyme [Gloeomargarita lithophora]APB33398.1 alanine racemase domain-containing protein [Gloeomargarita lithophora Alchichica-D10]
MSEDTLPQRLQAIQGRIPSPVRLVCVTKQVPIPVIRQAYALGLRDFGENRVQEAQVKAQALADLPDITWHLIGHLQSNKARAALQLFPWIHSVDSLAIAQKLDQLNQTLAQPAQLLLQVKLRPDPQKYGWTVPELHAALPALSQLQHVKIVGLMTILPLGLSPGERQHLFSELPALGAQLQPHLPLREYSMGMSDDYPQALAAGATMIRLGRGLFGERPLP